MKERAVIPLAFDFSCRTNDLATVLDKAIYVQNGYLKPELGEPKLYNRIGLQQLSTTAIASTFQVLDIGPANGPVGSFTAVGLDSTNGHLELRAYGTLSSSTLVKALATSGTFLDASLLTFPANTSGAAAASYLVGSGTNLYHYDSGTTTLTTIATIDGNPAHFYNGLAYLDTYAFSLTSRNSDGVTLLYNSDPGDLTTWNTLGYIQPDLKGGEAVGLESYKNHVVVFGSKNIVFFYDAGEPAPGSPLLPRQDLAYNFGTLFTFVNGGAPAKTWWKSPLEDTMAFIGVSAAGKKFVGMFEDFSVATISNDYISSLMQDTTDITICGYVYDGKTFIHICIEGNKSFYYDVETKLWHPFASGLTDLSVQPRLVKSVYVSSESTLGPPAYPTDGRSVVLSYSGGTGSVDNEDGKVYVFDHGADNHVDTDSDGATTHAIDLVIQTPKYRGDPGYKTRRKFHHELQLVSDTLASGTVDLTYSDDDYGTFSSARSFDMTASLKQLQRLGYFRERAFKLTYSGTEKIRLEALEGQFEIGDN